MRQLRAFLHRLRGLFRSRRADADFSAELEAHLALHTDEGIRSGLDPREARRQALIRLGGAEQTRQAHRERRTLPSFESFMQDLRFALRQLSRSPGFTFTAIFTLAIGIGANTAVFSLVDAVLLRPLPYRDPGKLMLITETVPSLSQDELGVAIQEARDYEARAKSFAQMGTFESSGFNLTGSARPLRINAARVSDSVFPLLGVAPALGRTFTPDENSYGRDHVAILSSQLWRNQFGGDVQILGKTIKLDETPYTVIGVMPPSFRFPFDGKPFTEMADLWVPDAIEPSRLQPLNRLNEFGVGLIGRIRPSIPEATAAAEVRSIASQFSSEHPDDYPSTMRVDALVHRFDGYSMQKARPLVVLLMIAVVCVLLIACANVANLLLARANRRAREMAIRAAVGANRVRLLRQCLVESLVLALAGAALGLILAKGILAALRVWGPASVPRLHDAAIDPLVLAFTLVLTISTGILFGIVPAWKLAHVVPQTTLKDSAQPGVTRAGHRLQSAIAIGEVALALVLLIAGGLLVRSLVSLLSTPIGFDPKGTIVVRTMFNRERYPDAALRIIAQREILDRLAHLPGVTRAAAASHLPLSDDRQIGIRMEHAAANDFHFAENSLVSPGYFQAMGIPLLRGRDFSAQDQPKTIPVAVVSEAFVRRYFPGVDPLGKRFYWGDREIFTIAGVVGDVHIAALDADPPPVVYNSMFQVNSGAVGRMAIVVRTSDDRQLALDAMKTVISSIDPDLPLYNVTSLSTLIAESLAQRRFTILLLGGFALTAALLAMIGLFGVLSYLVGQSRQEIGVRMALGADRRTILIMILRRGFLLATAGCAIGLPLSALATSLLSASLYHVERFDTLTFTTVPIALAAVVLCAALLPAMRAASIEPMQALRTE
jgi:putative ABC transport system permease protein